MSAFENSPPMRRPRILQASAKRELRREGGSLLPDRQALQSSPTSRIRLFPRSSAGVAAPELFPACPRAAQPRRGPATDRVAHARRLRRLEHSQRFLRRCRRSFTKSPLRAGCRWFIFCTTTGSRAQRLFSSITANSANAASTATSAGLRNPVLATKASLSGMMGLVLRACANSASSKSRAMDRHPARRRTGSHQDWTAAGTP